MKNSEYYTFKLVNSTDKPLLNNVDITIILTMENSKRSITDKTLLNLSRQTFLQINKGFKNTNKPVKATNEDIIHAYKNVFDNTINYNNIIILEDDARFNYKYSIDLLKDIDLFISKNTFDTYSFACLGTSLPINLSCRKCINLLGAQAIIYSPNARLRLRYSDGEHIDDMITDNLIYKYKHFYPLICQTFPSTENREVWGVGFYSSIGIFFVTILNGEEDIEPFWSVAYTLYDISIIILILVIIIICYI